MTLFYLALFQRTNLQTWLISGQISNRWDPKDHCCHLPKNNNKDSFERLFSKIRVIQIRLSRIWKWLISWVLTDYYGNTGCGVFKWGVQNSKDFCLRINILKGNYCILRIGLMGVSEVFKNQIFKSQFLKINPILNADQYGSIF